MNMAIAGALLVLVGLLLLMARRAQQKWATIVAASGEDSYEAFTKFEYLKSCGIRCKLKTDNPAHAGAAVGFVGTPNPAPEVTKILVRVTEMEKAQLFLEQFEKG